MPYSSPRRVAARFTGVAAGLALGALASAASAAVWIVDKPASHVDFTGAMSGQSFHGGFKRWDADIVFDPANLATSHVTARIETGAAAAGDQSRDEALPTPDWFSVKVFPTAVFQSRRIAAAGPGRYVADGDLTIRGVKRPVSLPFTLAIAGDGARMHGTLDLDRATFGVGQGQWKAGDTVALKVQVEVTVAAHKKK